MKFGLTFFFFLFLVKFPIYAQSCSGTASWSNETVTCDNIGYGGYKYCNTQTFTHSAGCYWNRGSCGAYGIGTGGQCSVDPEGTSCTITPSETDHWFTSGCTVTYPPPPPPPPPNTPVPPPPGGSCDTGCGTCGYRSNGNCTTNNGCCHRTCSGSNCVTVSGGGSNSCDNNGQCRPGSTPIPTTPPAACCSGINYYLIPVSPENPNTTMTVNIDRSTASMSCGVNNVGLYVDSDATSQALGLCYANGTNCGQGYHSYVNTRSSGTHTLQFTVNYGVNKCNSYTFTTSAPSCSVSFTNVPAQIIKGTTAQFITHIVPDNGATINGWTVSAPPAANVTLTPASGTVSPASGSEVVRTVTINTSFLSTGPFQITGGGTTAQSTTCSYTSSAINIVDPTTKFFTSAGGDVVVLGNGAMGTNLAQPNPAFLPFTYFIDKNTPSGIPGMGFGVTSSGSWYGNVDSTNVNLPGWLVNIRSSPWTTVLAKGSNSYAGMKLRLQNKVVTPVTYNSGTDLTQPALQNDSVDSKINGVVVMIANATVNLSAINVGTGKVILLVDGDVNINGEIHRDAGGFIAIFASGNITVAGIVGSSASDITILPVGHLEGIFFAGGKFDAGSSATNRLKIDGTVIGMTSVDLSGRTAVGVKPTIYFNFQPDLTATLNSVGLRQKTFQELLAP